MYNARQNCSYVMLVGGVLCDYVEMGAAMKTNLFINQSFTLFKVHGPFIVCMSK